MVTKKKNKAPKKPGTSLREINIASPGGDLQSYISSVYGIGILSAEEERKLAEDLYYRDDLEAARKLVLAHLRFVVHVARTYSGYGLSEADKMLDENAKLDPISLYAETKVNSEKILLEQLPKLQTTVVRCATAYGLASRVRFDLLLHEFIRDAWTKAKIYVYGAQSWRPIVHVDDIARAILLIIKNSGTLNKKDVYNVGSNDQNFQKISLAELVANRLKTDIEITSTKEDPRNYRVLFDKFTEELKFDTLHKPVETIEQIAHALESGLIDDRVLFESVNVSK